MLQRALSILFVLAQAVLLEVPDSAAAPFFGAGVQGVADANDSNNPCELEGGFSEGYRTFPDDDFVAFAEGQATAFNPCSALSGSPLSISSANLTSGQLRVYALAQIGQNGFTQEARADAFFYDDVLLFSGATPLDTLPDGLMGELRLSFHGSRSTAVIDASASLVLDALSGGEIGNVDIEDLQGGDTLVVPFNTSFHFFASLGVTVRDGQFADFGSTGTISVMLPEGYSFGSSSGVLLTPEPGGFASSCAAIGAIAALRGRTRV